MPMINQNFNPRITIKTFEKLRVFKENFEF